MNCYAETLIGIPVLWNDLNILHQEIKQTQKNLLLWVNQIENEYKCLYIRFGEDKELGCFTFWRQCSDTGRNIQQDVDVLFGNISNCRDDMDNLVWYLQDLASKRKPNQSLLRSSCIVDQEFAQPRPMFFSVQIITTLSHSSN